jgi:putative FmdB family regulatory protein
MPIYPFKCEDCGHVTTLICKMSEKEEKSLCEKCGSKNIKHEIYGLNFRLVGKFS